MKIKSLNSSVELNVFPGQGTDYSLRVVDAPDGMLSLIIILLELEMMV